MADAPSPSKATQPQPTPRVRRRGDQSDEPVGPDEVINVHNVHHLVTHDMIMSVFPAEVVINGNRRDFKEDARRGRIQMMIDCTSDVMVEAVSEGYPVYMRADFEKKGLPARGKETEFALIFVKLLYARGVLGRTVDFSRLPADESGSTPRRVRPRYTLTTVPSITPSGDGGGSASGSQAPIVPFGEGPSSQSSNQRSWLGPPDRDAILNWIDSGPFFLVDRRAYEAARLRLVETDAEEARLRSQLAQARDAEKAAEQALHLSSTSVGELTVRVSSADLRIACLSEEITEKDARIRELELELIGVNEDLAVERADRADMIDQLDEAQAAAGWDPEVVGDNGVGQQGEIPQPEVPSQPAQAHLSQAQAGTSNPVAQAGTSYAVAGTSNAQTETSNAQAGTSNAQAQADGPPLTEDQKLVINLQAQIASLNERLGTTEEALEIERCRNFADGSERSAWEWEKTILERRLEICTQERDNRVDMKMVVVRGQKSMWPPGKREEWNAANNSGDLYKIRRFFPGWAPLPETQGGTIGLYERIYQAGQPLFARLEHIDRCQERDERDFANVRLQPEDMTPTYHLRERAIDLMHYYLCPSRASSGTYAEYGEDVYEVVPSYWPPECFNFKKHFQGALVELHGGTANPQ
ncbi:hypothetical protein R1sor_019909 [Riccia sorocarpa]|uniref:Uncharacterized protein n=1 Tax=Riccia sorocarpa TaxID=122646 RepID=A0ABD3IGL1_9MARC